MDAQALVATLAARGVTLIPDADGLVARPASCLTNADREAIRAHKAELRRLLLCDLIEKTFVSGEWLAYRDNDQLVTARYAGTGTNNRVNVRLHDGANRAVAPEAVALDWRPDAAEMFEERLCIMLEAGLSEDVARPRAEQCTREYLERLRVLQ